MKHKDHTFFLAAAIVCSTLATDAEAASASAGKARKQAQSKPAAAEYFRSEAAALEASCLSDIHSLDEWKLKRPEYRRQLQEMLGLWPMPERTPLNPVITGKLEEDTFTVEKLQFQASPKLYVTANLYVPKNLKGPAPAVLYVCGHAKVVTNGVSCGNKANYQHHGIWFAQHGYVCLIIDTLQFGEILGEHRGTYDQKQWWWNARGYSPAGVEAWFGIRSIDYLCSRSEVDQKRIGMTGRSGGGSYSWTVAALDERIAVTAPIAGITDLRNQVVDGALEGHCDCMFYVNTYRWDFPQVAALIAPRPLLHGNSDDDRIFPLDGVERLYQKTRAIYDLYGARTNLGLLITAGPHKDTQDLQVPVFRWFNRYLKGDEGLVEVAARKRFSPEQLRVFDDLPKDEINTQIQKLFVWPYEGFAGSNTATLSRAQVIGSLRSKVFAGWPQKPYKPRGSEPVLIPGCEGVRCSMRKITSQTGIDLPLYLVEKFGDRSPGKIILNIIDEASWTNSFVREVRAKGQGLKLPENALKALQEENVTLAFFVPRGVEPDPAIRDAKTGTHVRRRYMLLGQTMDSMRVWDIRCAVATLKSLPQFKSIPLHVTAAGQMGVNAAYAALFEPEIQKLELSNVPASHMQGPDYLNVLRITDIPQVLDLLGARAKFAFAGK